MKEQRSEDCMYTVVIIYTYECTYVMFHVILSFSYIGVGELQQSVRFRRIEEKSDVKFRGYVAAAYFSDYICCSIQIKFS